MLAAVTLVALPVAAIAFARSRPGLAGNRQRPVRDRAGAAADPDGEAQPPVDRDLQETEARQMLEAKSYRRSRRGEAPIDVEAEVARLLAAPGAGGPGVDEKLRQEVRQLVVARNERRMRRGEEPLDVKGEIERQLADL